MTAIAISDGIFPMISPQNTNKVSPPSTVINPTDDHQLVQLLVPWVKCALENTSAETAVMILACGDQLLIQAIASTENDTVRVKQAISISTLATLEKQCLLLPLSLINQVAQTAECVLVRDATQDERFLNDAYIQVSRPLSILCEPIRIGNKLIGMMYLESKRERDAFTEEHVYSLQVLCSQAANALH